MALIGALKNALFGLSREEGSFARHRFPGCRSQAREHLEGVIHTFIDGYNLALAEPNLFDLHARIDSSFPRAYAGFAYEGAGLYLALADLMAPQSVSRLRHFTCDIVPEHDFITSVGAGFAIARVPLGLRRLSSYRSRLNPMTAWCLVDGYGFHQGFFHWERYIRRLQTAPPAFDAQDAALFDAGVGRAMWWVFGGNAEDIAAAIAQFRPSRQGEMWTGIGTALAYANGSNAGTSQRLIELSGGFHNDFLSGILLAAHMREKGGNPAAWTADICSDRLGMSVSEASAVVTVELDSWLESWRGSQSDQWSRCYLALRERLRIRLTQQPRDMPVLSLGQRNI